MASPCYHIDAFVGVHSRGNPAAVVLCQAGAPPAAGCMALAAEFNLSETAFVSPRGVAAEEAGAGDGGVAAASHSAGNASDDPFRTRAAFDLRWFTPTNEVALCGHGTLAAVHALVAERGNAHAALTFHTQSGPLVVRAAPGGRAAMRFPYNAPVCVCGPGATPPPALAALLAPALQMASAAGAAPVALHSVHYSAATRKLVVRLADGAHAQLDALAPDVRAMHRVEQGAALSQLLRGEEAPRVREEAPAPSALPPVAGVSVTVRAPPGDAEGACFYSRYFSPWNGIEEDPVNGSSHTVLGPYWAGELADGGAEEGGGQGGAVFDLCAVQRSARGGVLRVRVERSGEAAVHLEGACTTVYRGSLAGAPRAPWWARASGLELRSAAAAASGWPRCLAARAFALEGDAAIASATEMDAVEQRLGIILPRRAREALSCAGPGLPSPSLLGLAFPAEVCLSRPPFWARPPPVLAEELAWSPEQEADHILIGFNPEGADYSMLLLLRLSDARVIGVKENVPCARVLGRVDEWRAGSHAMPACMALVDAFVEEERGEGAAGEVQGDEAAAANEAEAAARTHDFYVRLESPLGGGDARDRAERWQAMREEFVGGLQVGGLDRRWRRAKVGGEGGL